ncbi:response regulator receiver protein [Stanieria cyanosphaera PCC 7437]|uniref:Response regulator receiver protein n=1 Tax=Stanieria cyanosphaera (strain ATCC 29371 / PCC 7437) TaxID=111780 RepID=K9XZE9_STAC7|nr:response regulator [Stanieria cyanosphaera]AFZ37414.1 response regulator receiver protein [Stanieria cyanosphaera PCC 7437]
MSKCVLIVDDEDDVRAIAKLGLEMAANWTVLTASSGQEGLNVAAQNHPDVILLDLMMPEWDGSYTLKQLKENPDTQSIPVILLTAKVQSPLQESLANLEVAAVFTKPFRPLQLPEQIEQVLAKTT